MLSPLAEILAGMRIEAVRKISSGYYNPTSRNIDYEKAIKDPEISNLCAYLICDELEKTQATAIGGLGFSSAIMAQAVATISELPTIKVNLKTFAPAELLGDWKINPTKKREEIVIVIDTCTDDASTIRAIRAAEAIGLVVVRVIILFDLNNSDGINNIRNYVADVYTLMTLNEITQDYHFGLSKR